MYGISMIPGADSAQDVICGELGVEWDVTEDIYEFLCDEYNPHNDWRLHPGIMMGLFIGT